MLCHPRGRKALFALVVLVPFYQKTVIFTERKDETHAQTQLEEDRGGLRCAGSVRRRAGVLAGCGAASSTAASGTAAGSAAASEVDSEEADEMAAKKVADLIDAIYVQERNENADAQCEAAGPHCRSSFNLMYNQRDFIP